MMAKTLWEALSRKAKPVSVSPRERITDLYGTDPRGRPNTRAAAEDLGVSQRTIQRWLKADREPSSPAGRQLTHQHQSWRSSAAGRAGQINSRREARLRKSGTTIQYKGLIAISADRRKRNTSVLLTGEQMSTILDATQAGDDDAALSALEDAFGDVFGGSVTLTPDDINTFR